MSNFDTKRRESYESVPGGVGSMYLRGANSHEIIGIAIMGGIGSLGRGRGSRYLGGAIWDTGNRQRGGRAAGI